MKNSISYSLPNDTEFAKNQAELHQHEEAFNEDDAANELACWIDKSLAVENNIVGHPFLNGPALKVCIANKFAERFRAYLLPLTRCHSLLNLQFHR